MILLLQLSVHAVSSSIPREGTQAVSPIGVRE